jgi:hypothetical protein
MKTIKHGILALAFCVMTLGFAQSALAAEELKGTWALEPTTDANRVHLALRHRSDRHNSNIEMDQPTSAFAGLDLATPGKHDVKFSMTRDAGRLDCEGYINDGEGAGTYRFTPDAKYVSAMSAVGFSDIDDNKQFAMALHDVSVEFAKQMKAEDLDNLDTDKLLAFRIFDVNPQFIREMRAAGLPAKDADKLIAFRVHGVKAKDVAAMRKSGIEADENQLIAFRVHGVTPEYVAKVEKLGLGRVKPDQLVAMRVHGVTPEYIANLKSRGMKDLTIDKVVNLKIHGID